MKYPELRVSFVLFLLVGVEKCSAYFQSMARGLTRGLILFLTSELANKAEINILPARDTTWAWVPGWGIMGNHVRVYKIRYNTWLSSRLQN